MIEGVEEISRIDGCMLRYTDRMPVPDGMYLPGAGDIRRLIDRRFDGSRDPAPHETEMAPIDYTLPITNTRDTFPCQQPVISRDRTSIMEIPGAFSIEPAAKPVPGSCITHKNTEFVSFEIAFKSREVPNTGGSVCSIPDRPGQPGWTLVFSMETIGPAGFDSGEAVLAWFDQARAGIHELFDLIVPSEIVETLR